MECYEWAPNVKNYILMKGKSKSTSLKLQCYDWPPEAEYIKHKKGFDLYQTCACAWALDKEMIFTENQPSWDNFIGHCF